jgi:predicted RNase H-like HicB family nuclease
MNRIMDENFFGGNNYLKLKGILGVMKQTHKAHNFMVLLERDQDGTYVASAPALKGCHSQGKTIDEAMANIKEAIELCLEVEKEFPRTEFIGIQQVQVRV